MAVFKGAEVTASDGNKYRWTGSQWMALNDKGETTKVATRILAMELDRIAAKDLLSTQESVFDNLLLKGIRTGQVPARTKAARTWFRTKAAGTEIAPVDLLAEKTRFKKAIVPGKMYFFQYYPKYYKTLPYYDAFPLVFPIERYNDGFLGLNMHYLPHLMRAKLMDGLYSISNNKRFDESTKIVASYQLLKSTTKFKYFAPTLHRYLTTKVQSRFIEVFSSEWDIALFLPVERFKKASKEKVWRDSKSKFK
jgi:hypothetical protein